MDKGLSNVIRSDMLSDDNHYYSKGEYLREKHRLAGDQYVKWSLEHIPSWAGTKYLMQVVAGDVMYGHYSQIMGSFHQMLF